jgi:XTP/dITP diphosphohydrolase
VTGAPSIRGPGEGAARLLVVATRNPGKLMELVPMFAALGLRPVDLVAAGVPESGAEEGLEVFETFAENALAKARHFHRLTGLPTVADDSGLAVEALGGAPGVRSKRWSERSDLTGPELDAANNAKLLAQLTGAASRHARFVCAVAYVDGDTELVRSGEAGGVILDEPRGDGGFGYDPLFLSDELGQTFAEAGREAKGGVSHRGRAFRALAEALRGVSGGSSGSGRGAVDRGSSRD